MLLEPQEAQHAHGSRRKYGTKRQNVYVHVIGLSVYALVLMTNAARMVSSTEKDFGGFNLTLM